MAKLRIPSTSLPTARLAASNSSLVFVKPRISLLGDWVEHPLPHSKSITTWMPKSMEVKSLNRDETVGVL